MAYKKRRTFKKKLFKRKSFAKKSPRKGIRRIVKAEISRQAEDKEASVLNLGVTLTSTNHLSFNTRNVIDIGVSTAAVQVYQGVGQGQRIGNKIKVKRMRFKGTLTPLQYTANNTVPRPNQIKMWIFYDKLNPTTTPTPQSDFFQSGNSSTAFQNDLVDMWLPVNTDKYRVLTTKTFKLGHASYGESNPLVYPTLAVSPYGGYNNNDFKLNCNFNIDLTKHIVRNVVFRDNNGDPTTRGIWAMFAYACADGTQYLPSTEAVNLQYMVSCNYEDM